MATALGACTYPPLEPLPLIIVVHPQGHGVLLRAPRCSRGKDPARLLGTCLKRYWRAVAQIGSRSEQAPEVTVVLSRGRKEHPPGPGVTLRASVGDELALHPVVLAPHQPHAWPGLHVAGLAGGGTAGADAKNLN